MKNSRHNLLTFTSSLLLGIGIFSSPISFADDTEIFFGGPAIDEGIKPNVLFILDNSGSMNWRLNSNTQAGSWETSRLTVLKDTFEDILSNTTGINAGVMVLNSRSEYGSSRFMYPVTDIDSELPTGTELVASRPLIMVSGDDATQAIAPSGTAVIDAPSLVMGQIGVSNVINNQTTSTLATDGAFFRRTLSGVEYACRFSPPAGTRANCNNGTLTTYDLDRDNSAEAVFKFESLGIPANANIQSAYLIMRPTNDDGSRNPNLSIRMEAAKTQAALNDNNPIGTRNYNTSTVTTTGGWQTSRDINVELTNQLRSLQTVAPAGDPISSVLLRISSDSRRTQNICVAGACMPRLVVTYTTTAITPESRMAALRFQEVGIPQGATITSASISFVPAASSSEAVTFRVKAESTDDAGIFTNGSNIAGRGTTAAAVEWTPAAWEQTATPAPVEGPTVTSLVQEVVSRAGWCGNNSIAFHITPISGTGSRVAYSLDGSSGLQPILNVSYTGGESGCLNPIIELRVNAEKNDGRESSSGRVRLGENTLPLDRNTIAARYESIPVRKDAQVLDAKVIVTPANTVTTPSTTADINFHNANNSAEFSSNDWHLYNRGRTSDASCTFSNSNGGWVAGQAVTCSSTSIASSLQEVFARSGWAANNAISLFLDMSADSSLDAVAYETNPAQSLKLRFKVRSGDTVDQTTTKVRDHLISLVNNMYAESGTPIVPTMYDAARYIRGSISGRASPITSSCQATHLVLLTDGQANSNTDTAKTGIGNLIGETCTGDASDDGELCARSLATYLFQEDQSDSIPDDNVVITHTVGFALDASGEPTSGNIKRFLEDIADNGNGTFNTAESAEDLAAAFQQIIQSVLSTDASFVSASAPVNSFNRQDNKDQVYFSVFKPMETDLWQGNLKRYRLDAANARIVDVDDVDAVDVNTGFFKSTAKSWWSDTADGNQTSAGGAANELPAPASRNLFTYIGTPPSSSTSLNQSSFALSADNALITNDLLGVDNDTERTAALNFIRGLNGSTARKAMGDPLHSSPRLATYACNDFSDDLTQCLDEDQSAIVGSNEGFLHVIDTSTGAEQFAFMPQELLPNIVQLQANLKSTSLKPRPYGMDNTVALWVNDANNNGVIYGGYDPETKASLGTGVNDGEFVYAYATMGRGGHNIYALDITNRAAPKVLWEIKGNDGAQTPTPGFERLGQTWSVPVKTRIKVGSTTTDVLIFAGGYDEDQDEHDVRTADDVGNAIYIVNARTGELIWSASNTTGHTQQLSEMDYSMPSSVRVIDLQQDDDGTLVLDDEQLADQFFVGDMGGQVWRFYINNGQTGADLITPAGSSGNGVFASVTDNAGNTAQLEAKARRFYHEPDAALINLGGTLALTINIGSGYRGHPLNETIEDRFYSFRTAQLTKGAAETTLTESDLYDATANLVQVGTDSEKEAAKNAFESAEGGWMIRLNTGGEKVLSRALTIGGKLYFNSYEPTTTPGSCSASVGLNRAYTVSLKDATPAATDVSSTAPSARYSVIKTTGLLADPTVSSIGKDSVLLRFPSIEKIDGVQQGKTYWMDVENLE